MTERIDHAAGARTILSNIQPHEMGAHGIADWLSLAQLHATLALVEQQRTSNMQTERAALRARADGRGDLAAAGMEAQATILDLQIREALGLT